MAKAGSQESLFLLVLSFSGRILPVIYYTFREGFNLPFCYEVWFKIFLISIFLTGCSLSDLKNPFTDLISSDEILFLSAYENVKIVEQTPTTGQNSHPINISEERIEGAKVTLFRVGRNTKSLSW